LKKKEITQSMLNFNEHYKNHEKVSACCNMLHKYIDVTNKNQKQLNIFKIKTKAIYFYFLKRARVEHSQQCSQNTKTYSTSLLMI
jgi:hypothetical protein